MKEGPPYKRMKQAWQQKFGRPQPLFQPQIDIVLKGADIYTLNHLRRQDINFNTFENENLIRAIEVKRFTVKNRYPYYKGLDQAIAYLRFGFDAVALWHVFDEEVINYNIEYAYRSWEFIREMALPLEFTTLILEDNNLYPVNIVPKNNKPELKILPEIGTQNFQLMWRHPNPYSRKTEGLRFRTLINEWLDCEMGKGEG